MADNLVQTPGWKTSEFLMTVAGAVIGYLWTAFQLPPDGLHWILGLIATYVANRMIVKKADAAASAPAAVTQIIAPTVIPPAK